MATILLSGNDLTVDEVVLAARQPDVSVALTDGAMERIAASRLAVERFLASGQRIYGITTGFGALKDHFISSEHSRELQRNMILSHSVGVGEPLDEEVVRAMLLIRANALAKGCSGVRLAVVQLLLDLLKHGIYPVIPSKGSVGSSGDLAPLVPPHADADRGGRGHLPRAAHAQRRGAGDGAGSQPIALEAKEGLALINGTAAMTGIAALALHDAENLARVADVAGAMSLEAMRGVPQALDARLHAVRPYAGQQAVAAHLRALTAGSELLFRRAKPDMPAGRVHDAYSLRCMPQVHGAVRDALAYVRGAVSIELNAATDNPLLFVEDGEAVALSGGNFHGEPIALAMDCLGIAVAELGSISERRIARLVDNHANEGVLPPFLTPSSGLHSGFMLAQYTAAALVSENKVLAHPASVDSIPTSAGMEDHVSMGTIAARKGREIVGNVTDILAIELMAAAQGIDLRLRQQPGRLGKGTEAAHRMVREVVPYLERDVLMYPHLAAVRALVSDGRLGAVLGDGRAGM